MDVRTEPPRVPSRLGIGPVSRNVVDAAVRLAYRRKRHVMLVASRGQIECVELGGGYVEQWSTSGFAGYVREHDPKGLMLLCRDHGGPWQHPDDAAPGELASDTPDRAEARAIGRCLISLRADIDSGFDLLHLDTSHDSAGEAEFDRALQRLLVLYDACKNYAESTGQRVAYEIGLERQVPDTDDPDRFAVRLDQIMQEISARGLPKPTFVVAQTGTMVVAAGNRGLMARSPEDVGRTVGEIARRCRDSGVALKAHNVDYLPARAVGELFRRGTGAVNVAPEFGVCETRAFLDLLTQSQLTAERDRFLGLAYDSGRWRRWAAEDTGDFERAVLAGHYVFGTDEFRELKERADHAGRARRTSVDTVLGEALDRCLGRYADLAWGALP